MQSQVQQSRRTWLICLALGLITFAVYVPALRHDFLDYDDQQYVTENPRVRAGFSSPGLVWAFGFHASNWHPLTWLSHMLDVQLHGVNPAGHHLTNVLLHVANTMLLFLVFQRMTGAAWRSAGVAALFAWHPLHVESVAWIAERKDVLSAFFWMLSLLAYAGYAKAKTKIRTPKSERNPEPESHPNPVEVGSSRITHSPSFLYLLTLLLFSLGLMSKPMVVTLPFVLLLLDFWPLERVAGRGPSAWTRLVLEKLPFFALSSLVCVLTLAAQRQGLSVVSVSGLSITSRIVHALLAYAHYLGATFAPAGLAVYYPYQLEVPATKLILAVSVLAMVSAVTMVGARKRPYLLVGWLWFLGTLVPVTGLVQVGDQAWADRYTYLPLIGIFVMTAWGMADLVQMLQTSDEARSSWVRVGWGGLGLVIGGALLTATSVQLRHWRNTRSLFEHATRVTERNHLATTLLGSLLAKEGRLDEAIERYRAALSWKPGYPEAHFFLGNAFDQRGNLDQAIREYRSALGSKPMQEQTRVLLAIALAKQGSNDEAIAEYLAALKVNPESAVAHQNLARLLHSKGDSEQARGHYETALRLDPTLARAHNNLGILLIQQGNPAQGATHLRESLRLKPGDPETEYNLALALSQQGLWAEAEPILRRTATASADPKVYYQFALVLARLQRTREAMSWYARALLAQPDFPDALDALAWLLATATDQGQRNGAEALRMAERACELTGRKDPAKLKTLAAAYAEGGNYSDAVTAIEKARDLARAANRPSLVQECLNMAATFKAGNPWREPNSSGL